LCFFLIACSILLAGVEVGEIVAVAAGALASGEAVGACPNELNASAREQM
jgi:type IV secretory pathway TrbL component